MEIKTVIGLRDALSKKPVVVKTHSLAVMICFTSLKLLFLYMFFWSVLWFAQVLNPILFGDFLNFVFNDLP